MPFLSSRLDAVRPSATKAMTAAASRLKAEGRDVVVLSQGEPDFDTPAHVRAAGIAAINDGHTRYTPVAGIPALRQAIADKLARENGINYLSDQVTVGCGAKQILFNALFATLNNGDEVVIPVPCWVSYPELVKLCGGTPVLIHCARKTGFKLTPEQLEAAITPRTKWLMLNSPSNPTGAVYSASDLKDLAEVLARHPHVWVMTDDIYEKLVYDGITFATLPQVAPALLNRSLVVNGVSKSAAMTGWRVGYGAGPDVLIKAMNTIQGQSTSHTSSISQHAALEAISGDQSFLNPFVTEYQARRDLMANLLNQAPGLDCDIPEGAFYLFPDCSGIIGRRTPAGKCLNTDGEFALYLLEQSGVAVVSGESFLASPFIRVSYAASREELQEAGKRIIQACELLT